MSATTKSHPLSAGDVIDRYLLTSAWVDDRTHYNLACYYTRVARKLKDDQQLYRALEHLRAATETRDLAVWAERDPALQHLRDSQPTEFDQAIGKAKPSAPAPSLLARVPGIGSANVKKLAVARVSSLGDLLDLASQKDDREVLSNETGIPAGLIEKWALLAELAMLRHVDIDLDQVALLDAAGLGSIASLAKQGPLELEAALANVKETCDAHGEVPTEDEAARWIAAARRTTSRVERA